MSACLYENMLSLTAMVFILSITCLTSLQSRNPHFIHIEYYFKYTDFQHQQVDFERCIEYDFIITQTLAGPTITVESCISFFQRSETIICCLS